MPTYTVYVDQVFLGSLVMNLMILWVTARLGGVAYARWRLVLGAALGALYSLVLFVPAWQGFLAPGYKFMVSVLIVAAAFWPRQPARALVLLGYFYLATFALGGTVQGLIGFLNGRYSSGFMAGVMQAVDTYLWYGVLLALVLFWALGRVAPAKMRKRLMLPLLRVDLSVGLGGRRADLPAFLDTGNALSDPVTGDPVVVAEYDAVQEVLPERVRAAVEKHGPDRAAEVLAELGAGIAEGYFRLIPYRTVGREMGWLLGFRPDEMELRQGGTSRRVQAVVAICGDRLEGDTPCRALVPHALLDTGPAG